jgi:hypothetical protein
VAITPEVVDLVKTLVEEDIVGALDGLLTPDPEVTAAFCIRLGDGADIEEPADVVTTSDSLVAVPWSFSCVHTGPFLDIPPTYVHFDLVGATFIHVRPEPSSDWVFRRYIDYLCALHHIGVSTNVRPALSVPEYLGWELEEH